MVDHQQGSKPLPKRCTDTVPGLDIRALEREDALAGGYVHARAWRTAHGPVALRWWLSGDHLVVAPGRAHDPVAPATLTWVPLLRTRCEVTAVRRWFGCPACGARVGVLYVADGALACRRCHGLAYRSQGMGPRPRALAALAEIDRRLESPSPNSLPIRPRGMHRRTYVRLLERRTELQRVLTGDVGR